MRVSIFDAQPDGRIVFRAEDDLAIIMPERDDAYEEAVEALYIVGYAFVGGGAAPEVMLVRTGGDADRERAALRTVVAGRALMALRRQGPTPLTRADLVLALMQAEDQGCRLRLRDLAAADEADVVHDVMGIHANRNRVTGAVDLTTFRPRFLEGPEAPHPEAPVDEQLAGTAEAAEPSMRAFVVVTRTDWTPAAPTSVRSVVAIGHGELTRALRAELARRYGADGIPAALAGAADSLSHGAWTLRGGAWSLVANGHAHIEVLPLSEPSRLRGSIHRMVRSRMDLHRSRLSLEALAAGAALPWQVDETDLLEDRCIVIRDADSAYVCELALNEFDGPADAAVRQARDIAQLICAAVLGKAPNDALDRDLAEAAAETVGASHG